MKAAFSLIGYKFDRVTLDLTSLKPEANFEINFAPTGIFYPDSGRYRLTFTFTAKIAENESDSISVNCLADYKFEDVHSLEDIPEYFYANSIAILFPYVRAFVSTVTLQANIKPIVLPTYNVSPLQEMLIKNTVVADGDRE